jgi:hypothetical protein
LLQDRRKLFDLAIFVQIHALPWQQVSANMDRIPKRRTGRQRRQTLPLKVGYFDTARLSLKNRDLKDGNSAQTL